MIFNPLYDKIAPASAWIPLLYDTTVITLVIMRTLPARKNKATFMAIGTEMLREGIMYYGVVFAVTFTLTLMIAFADPGIKNICAQLELCLTSVMMSRITLALKRHLVDLGAAHRNGRISNPLEWGAVTRPPRIALSRGRVQYVERAERDAGMLAVVSHVAGKEDMKATVTIVGCEGNADTIEMEELSDKDMDTPISDLPV